MKFKMNYEVAKNGFWGKLCERVKAQTESRLVSGGAVSDQRKIVGVHPQADQPGYVWGQNPEAKKMSEKKCHT